MIEEVLPTVTGVDPGPETPGFRRVPRTGVIYVMHRAAAAGHGSDGRTWYNLGQGSPEVDDLPGAPPRRNELHIDPRRQTYAPVDGIDELRDRVAELYNFLYRRNKRSQYSRENVSIAPGGRPAMTRIAAAMGEMNLGHFIPDYTAYEELLTAFKGFIPIPILLDAAHGYRASRRLLEKEIVGRGLSALWCSNPCNPTGQLVEGDLLAEWVGVARDNACTFILDEFYSHYIYTPAPPQNSEQVADTARMVSAAAHVDDVNRDPVILVDGLTKNWRYPGWRVSWIVGPVSVIDRVTSAGSFLDGGGNHPFQEAAVPLLEPELVLQETQAIQTEFAGKRRFLVDRLRGLGIEVEHEPSGAFYVWGNLAGLPAPLNDGIEFFKALLQVQVITVPGVFFDVNPGQRRRNARYHSYCRLSFGPSMETLERGMERIEKLIRAHS
ncbi:MAG: pyridoxal phosphate-dependent aminotransferase [Acidobacteria bacterium]|nr:pyridoxal phosphate-dependent aminotransferase [Acidobacteriota bacterium]